MDKIKKIALTFIFGLASMTGFSQTTLDYPDFLDLVIHDRSDWEDYRRGIDSLAFMGRYVDSTTLVTAYPAASSVTGAIAVADNDLWVNDGTDWNRISGGGVTKLHELSDVDTIGTADNYIFQYELSDDEWQPEPDYEVRARDVTSFGGTTHTIASGEEEVESTGASAATVTYPLNASDPIKVGTWHRLYQRGSGQVELVGETSGVAIVSPDSTDAGEYLVLRQGGYIDILKTGTDEIRLTGELEGGYNIVGAWNTISFSTDWGNFTGYTAQWRLVVINGENWIQFNGARIEFTGTDTSSSEAFDLTASITKTLETSGYIFEDEDGANAWDASGFIFATDETFTVITADGTNGVEGDDTYYLPTEYIPLF